MGTVHAAVKAAKAMAQLGAVTLEDVKALASDLKQQREENDLLEEKRDGYQQKVAEEFPEISQIAESLKEGKTREAMLKERLGQALVSYHADTGINKVDGVGAINEGTEVSYGEFDALTTIIDNPVLWYLLSFNRREFEKIMRTLSALPPGVEIVPVKKPAINTTIDL